MYSKDGEQIRSTMIIGRDLSDFDSAPSVTVNLDADSPEGGSNSLGVSNFVRSSDELEPKKQK